MPQKITRPQKVSKKQRVLEFAAAHGWTRIGEAEWRELREALPDVSVSVIQQAGVPMEAPWCGVHQHTFEELEDSLRRFSAIYESRPDLSSFTRQQVIAAKDRAKFLAARATLDAETRERKTKMAEWMLIWLGDPVLFPAWLSALQRYS